ncbi:protoporphyrinogen oxidase [Actinoalloteichus caeruleus]|uniref:Coproporphyrinogen III oxidase n=1 Tax=Actinoalloteichus caeruleus DSM 43889 TaxID=1120930 RepID=A0ABT1JHU5_ACTCY|nr:protoporphyrinogen oxidase [Actinoalloteichus caeruleus]MCP2331726.1 oxygen-dependent protoporphyrinogen oxidase [Actinoalloteichus caeruleus DSM 43889]
MTHSSASPRVAVVGGGVAGLTAAHRLRKRLGPDARITVIDQGRAVGGKLRAVPVGGVRYDLGAEAYLARRPEIADLLGELDVDVDLVHPSGAAPTVRAGGRTVPLPRRTFQGLPETPQAVRDVLSPASVEVVASEADQPPVDLGGRDVSLGRLVRERLGDEVVDRLVDPLLGGVYAGRADDLGLRATMPGLASRLDEEPSTLLAAVSHLMPPPVAEGQSRPPVFATLREGLATLPELLLESSAADLRLGLPVRAVEPATNGWRLEIGSAARPESLSVDLVVLAVPAPAAARLLADVAPGAAAAYREVELASSVVVGLALPPGTVLPDSSGVLVAAGERHDDGTPFTAKAFTYSSRKWPHLAGGGDAPVLVRGSVGRFGEASALRRGDEEITRGVLADLTELLGTPVRPLDTAVVRWGGALPQYGVGHLDRVARITSGLDPVVGIAAAGAALGGVGVPACVASGNAAADKVLDDLDQLRAARPAGARM